jgi:Flp pilus assembly pilin Flp
MRLSEPGQNEGEVGVVRQIELFRSKATERMLALGEEDGQALVEYALIMAFVVTLCVAGLTGIGAGVSELLTRVADGFP